MADRLGSFRLGKVVQIPNLRVLLFVQPKTPEYASKTAPHSNQDRLPGDFSNAVCPVFTKGAFSSQVSRFQTYNPFQTGQTMSVV
jgi:hypothetical protein